MPLIKKIVYILRIEYLLWVEYIANFLIAFLPGTPTCNAIKKMILVLRGAKIGRNVYIYSGVHIDHPNKLTIGDDAVISKDVLITTSGVVFIGTRAMIGYSAKLLSVDHVIPESACQPIRFSGHSFGPIVIEDDAWVCANAVVSKGVTIGRGAVVAAGAVVTKNVAPAMIVAGVPAKVIRSRSK